MNVKQIICKNLEGRVHGVNLMTALRGVIDTNEGLSALNDMVGNQQVKVIKFPVPGHRRNEYFKLYRLQ